VPLVSSDHHVLAARAAGRTGPERGHSLGRKGVILWAGKGSFLVAIVFLAICGPRNGRERMVAHGASQFTSRRPGTLSKCFVLSITKVRSWASAIEAIIGSTESTVTPPLTHDRVEGVPILLGKAGGRAGGPTERRDPRVGISYRYGPDRDLNRHAVRDTRIGL